MGQKLDTTAEIVKSYCTLKAGYTSECVGCVSMGLHFAVSTKRNVTTIVSLM